MGNRAKNSILAAILMPTVCVAVLLFFLSGISNVSHSRDGEEKRRLEDAIRRNAVDCYAAEGMYPPALEYLEEHGAMRVADYMELTGLSRTVATMELKAFRQDPNSGVDFIGRGSAKVYVKKS